MRPAPVPPDAVFQLAENIAVGRVEKNHKPGEKIMRLAKTFKQEKSAQQHFRQEANINSIMAKYARTGILVEPGKTMRSAPQFGIFEQFDFQEAQNKVCQAKEAFMALPARIRARFSNNPAQLLDFISDESNRAEALALGIIQETKSGEKPEEIAVENPPAI